MMRQRPWLIPAVLLLAASPFGEAWGDSVVYSYTDLIVPGASTTIAYGINSSNQVVGYTNPMNGVVSAFLESGGNYTSFVAPGASIITTAAFGINDSGTIVGAEETATNSHGYIATGVGTMNASYTLLDDPNAVAGGLTLATGINNAGLVVGYYGTSATAAHGFIYNGSTYVDVDDPNAGQYGTRAYGVNSSGVVSGSYTDVNGASHGFTYLNGVYTDINVPGAIQTGVEGINDAGDVVGAYTLNGSTFYGFVYDGTTVVSGRG